MIEISLQIQNIISDELKNINQKIKGTGFLEILKYKILDRLVNEDINIAKLNNKISENIFEEFKLNHLEKQLFVKISIFNTPLIQLNTKLNDNLLMICLKKNIKIGLENYKDKKIIDLNLVANTGITLSSSTICNLNYIKDSIILEIYLEDDSNDVEI